MAIIIVALCWICYRIDGAAKAIKCSGHILAPYLLTSFIIQYAFINHTKLSTNLSVSMLIILIVTIILFLPCCATLESFRTAKPIEPAGPDSPPSYDDLFPPSYQERPASREITVF